MHIIVGVRMQNGQNFEMKNIGKNTKKFNYFSRYKILIVLEVLQRLVAA